MVSSKKDDSSSEETKSANSECGASWQQDSDEEDRTSSEGPSRRTYKRQRTSSLPSTHKMNIVAPTYPNLPAVNSSLFQNPWTMCLPWMCPPWMCPPWMYAQQMPMSPPWTMGAQPAVMPYNTPWMQVSPTQWDNLQDYGGNGSQMKKVAKRVKARQHVKNVSHVGRKVKLREVLKLKKKRGNNLSSTEKTERLQVSLQASARASEGNRKKKSKFLGLSAARLSATENRQTELEGELSKILANNTALTESIHELQATLVEIVAEIDSQLGWQPKRDLEISPLTSRVN